MPATGKFFGVGLGPGDPDLITRKGWEALCQADIIYTVASRQGSSSQSLRIVKAQPGVKAELRELVFAMNQDWEDRLSTIDRHAADIAAELKNGYDCAFVTIGDVLTYSTCGYLLEALMKLIPNLNKTIVPGVNSWSALTAANADLVSAIENRMFKLKGGDTLYLDSVIGSIISVAPDDILDVIFDSITFNAASQPIANIVPAASEIIRPSAITVVAA